MNISQRRISDPVIAPSGKIYSAHGIKTLLAALFPNRVDDPAHCCNTAKRRRKKYGKRSVDHSAGGCGTA
ncbi:MAG: hypothetical protein E7058_04510 [Lentisphaerae bacterium]|nr:hypothetical protein [Lentisphaerota bacterium]